MWCFSVCVQVNILKVNSKFVETDTGCRALPAFSPAAAEMSVRILSFSLSLSLWCFVWPLTRLYAFEETPLSFLDFPECLAHYCGFSLDELPDDIILLL